MSVRINQNAIEGASHIDGVRRFQFESEGEYAFHPDGRWEIVVIKNRRGVQIVRTGQITRSVAYSYEEGDEILALSFKASSFMPLMPATNLVDQAVTLGRDGSSSLWLAGSAFEIPRFDNADVFAERLRRLGLVQTNAIVASVLEGAPRAMSERTFQRHFQATTGVTYKRFTMIERAQEALSLLRLGRPAADVAFSLGYSDQAHLINSLRDITGLTPSQIALPPGSKRDRVPCAKPASTCRFFPIGCGNGFVRFYPSHAARSKSPMPQHSRRETG